MDFDRYIENQRLKEDLQERKYIRCEYCEDEIYSEYFEFEGTILCLECFDNFQKYIKERSRKFL